MADSNPTKLCECGCGQPTRIATVTRRKRGHIKGKPVRFIVGHNEKNLRHGHARAGKHSREHMAWMNMINRCTKPKNKDWPRYGGRGITVCERWRNSFEAFLSDMGQCPPGFQIDRKANDLGYYPENCVWVDRKAQNRNKRVNVYLTHNGETMVLADWARRIGVDPQTLAYRIRRDWPLDRALSPKRFKTHWRPKTRPAQ